MTKKQSKATKTANAQRVAERAAGIRKEQERKERKRRTVVISAVVLVVLAGIAAISYAVQSSRDTTGQSATPPSGVVDTYGVPFGKSHAPVKVAVYEDFMCPFCGQFEAASSDMVQQYVDSGDVQVQYQVVPFLDRFSNGTDYSTRSMNALGVVLDTSGPEVAKTFHDLLYENQPGENSDGLSDDQLIAYAVQAGATESDVSGPINSLEFEQWVENAKDAASKAGVNSTPTVIVDGKDLGQASVDELIVNMKKAIDVNLAQ